MVIISNLHYGNSPYWLWTIVGRCGVGKLVQNAYDGSPKNSQTGIHGNRICVEKIGRFGTYVVVDY